MNEISLRLMGVVSEMPRQSAAVEQDHVCQELREVLEENDRLIERNRALKGRLATALLAIAVLQAAERPDWGASPRPTQSSLEVGRLRLNEDLRLLSLDGRDTHLSKRMLELLAYLMARPNRVIPTDTLANALGMSDGDAVRALVWRLRGRLAEIGALSYLRSYGRSWSGGGYWMSCSHEGAER